MELGAFSLSLNVQDIHRSKAFYEKLGFTEFGGDASQGWLILRNGSTTLGLFQGMFEKNTLTFNPGWNADSDTQESFTDIRELQQKLKDQGVNILTETDSTATGPGHIVINDPDGNPILIDQHV